MEEEGIYYSIFNAVFIFAALVWKQLKRCSLKFRLVFQEGLQWPQQKLLSTLRQLKKNFFRKKNKSSNGTKLKFLGLYNQTFLTNQVAMYNIYIKLPDYTPYAFYLSRLYMYCKMFDYIFSQYPWSFITSEGDS